MPRRSILSAAECDSLRAFPETQDELIRHYTFSEADLSIIRQRRGNHNRLGFAVQLCYLRYPGFVLPTDAVPPTPLLAMVGRQLCVELDIWPQYAQRPETRREHLVELQAWIYAPQNRALVPAKNCKWLSVRFFRFVSCPPYRR